MQDDSLRSFTEALGEYLTALNTAQSTWLAFDQDGPTPDWKGENRQQHTEALSGMESARRRLRLWLRVGWLELGTAPQITPRPGQSAAQWTANLMANVEAAWHLCRFMHVYSPTPDPKLTGDQLSLQQEMLERLPSLCSLIREEWQYVTELQRATAALPEPAQPQSEMGNGVAPRNAWFLAQYEARGTDTYHKPAKIHAMWERMNMAERAAICPDSPNKIARVTVEQAIKRMKPRKAKRATRKSK